jgi:alpha-ribazole phosphatase
MIGIWSWRPVVLEAFEPAHGPETNLLGAKMSENVCFWLIRHAVVEGPPGTIWAPTAPAHLSDRAALDRLRKNLPSEAHAYASPARRTLDTAEALHLNPELVPEFAEQDFGDWTGHRHDDLAASEGDAYGEFWKDPAHSVAPGGESFSDQVARVRQGLGRIQKGPAVLVVHSGTVRAALAIALDIEPEAALRFVIEPLSLTRIERVHSGWRVLSVNQRFY